MRAIGGVDVFGGGKKTLQKLGRPEVVAESSQIERSRRLHCDPLKIGPHAHAHENIRFWENKV